MIDPIAVSQAHERPDAQFKLCSAMLLRMLGQAKVAGCVGLAAMLASIVSLPGIQGVLGGALALVMLLIAVVDRYHFIIPDEFNAAALLLALLNVIAQQPQWIGDAIGAALMRATVFAAVLLAVRIGYAHVRGRQGLGLGDVKLAFVAGAWLDWVMLPIAIEVAALAALLIYAVGRGLKWKSFSLSERIPFGCFLAPAIWVCWFLQSLAI